MISTAWAQAAHGAVPPQLLNLMPLVLILGVFYFLLIRPQQQKAKEHREVLANLKRNDEVITNGGLYGRVIQLSDRIVTLEIAPNVRVRVDRPQIAGLATREDAKSKDESKAKENQNT